MGLLDSIFGTEGTSQSVGGGGPSKMALALMALLAYRAYGNKGGAGGLGGMLGGGQPQGGGYGTGQAGGYPGGQGGGYDAGRGAPPAQGGGGLGGILGSLLGGGTGAQRGGTGGGLGGLLGSGMGGMLGGAAAGTLLNGGLNEILRRFQQNGMGHAADTWVGHGPNRAVAPDELENAVGRDTLQELSTETGRPYNEVLSELSRSLPDTVDKLTPDGRIPTHDEASRW